MEQMKNNNALKQVWKYFAGGATVLAYGAAADRIKRSNNILEIQNNINTVQYQLNKMENQLSSNLDIETRKQIMQKVKELTFDLNNLKAIHNNYISKFEGNINSNPESSLNIYNQYKEQIDNTFKKANTKANEIIDILNNTKERFMEDGNPISKIILEYREYLDTLS